MASSTDAAGKRAGRRSASSPGKNGYLILYNVVSAILWAAVLGRTVGANLLRGPSVAWAATGELAKWTQTLMVMDVLHAMSGIVPSSPLTTAAQVSSRFVLVWGVVHPFPQLARSAVYSTMLLAWSLTELIRYSYLALKLAGIEPYPYLWLRYSSYRVLYPLGIVSEMSMMYMALGPAAGLGQWYSLFLRLSLGLIWPAGAYILIGHMNRQRRKVLGQHKGQKATQ